MKSVVVSLSGGMDSSTLLLRALSEYDNVIAVSFDYGQKHRVELERAQSLVNYLKEQGQQVKYQTIKLDGLTPLLNSALVEGGEEVPEGHYEQENMKATVVPNRNKIFSSIVQAIALSAATQNDSTCDIALGIHAGDHAIYPDCRQEWRDADDQAFRVGNWDVGRVGHFTPYLHTDKFGILQDPVHYRIDIAPAGYKQQLTAKYREHIEWLQDQDPLQRATQGFESAITFMNATDNTHLIDTFWRKTHELDTIRNENILNIIPELKALK